MSKIRSYVIAGLGIGIFFGLSTGVAMGGTAYNGAVVFGPLGALIGWLFARGEGPASRPDSTVEEGMDVRESQDSLNDVGSGREAGGFEGVLSAVLSVLAGIWNFHVDILDILRILPMFKSNPWLFVGLAVAVSIFFPPFFVIYFFCWGAASHYGISAENGFRAKIQ